MTQAAIETPEEDIPTNEHPVLVWHQVVTVTVDENVASSRRSSTNCCAARTSHDLHERGARRLLESRVSGARDRQHDRRDARIRTEIDGTTINGVDLIVWNEAGRIVEFKVSIRPLEAVLLVGQKMQSRLAAGSPAANSPESCSIGE
jgi:hypothetical protein